jgi:hypothetical protein
MGRPSTSMSMSTQGGRNTAAPGGRGAAGLFLASTQQGGAGGKTNSEKIMVAVSGEFPSSSLLTSELSSLLYLLWISMLIFRMVDKDTRHARRG